MLDLSKFSKTELEMMLEVRQNLLSQMQFINNIQELVNETEQIKEFLTKLKDK
jgi:hypothetical protein